jgi:hypothetical protein
MRSNCRICGTPLEQPARGRKRVYCGSLCRRKRERLLARLRRVLRRMEQRAEHYAIPGNSWGAYQLPFLVPKLEAARRALADAVAQR